MTIPFELFLAIFTNLPPQNFTKTFPILLRPTAGEGMMSFCCPTGNKLVKQEDDGFAAQLKSIP